MDLADIRNEYTKNGLTREALQDSPFKQFELWFKQAQKAQIKEVNAMSLATASKSGLPQVRTVLLKMFDEEGYVFFTNYKSAKAHDIDENPQVSILFPWLDLERQVRITGLVKKINKIDSFKYFSSRPRGSQLGAWISEQSSVVSSRAILKIKFEQMKQKFKQGEIPLPDAWGGYRLVPDSFEFWQGRENRLHDRFKYLLDNKAQWTIRRLAP